MIVRRHSTNLFVTMKCIYIMVVMMSLSELATPWSALVPAYTPFASLSSISSAVLRECKSAVLSSSILLSCHLVIVPQQDVAIAATLPSTITSNNNIIVSSNNKAAIPSPVSSTSINSFELLSVSLADPQSTPVVDDVSSITPSSIPPVSTKGTKRSDNSIDIDFQKLQESLSLPTEDRPQIKLPDESTTTTNNNNLGPNQSNNNNLGQTGLGLGNNNFNTMMQNKNNNNEQPQPFVQGMVYLLNPNDRPDLSDTIVLTVASTSNPDNIIAGAKYDVSKARFPFQFRLGNANMLVDPQLLSQSNGNIDQQDFMVTVQICSSDKIPNAKPKQPTKGTPPRTIPCNSDESTFTAKGISKVVGNLPGMAEGTVFRTAASLPLERVGDR